MIAAFNIIFDDLPKQKKKDYLQKNDVDASNKLLIVAIFDTIFQFSNV